MRVMSHAEAAKHEQARREAHECARKDPGVVGQQMFDGVLLNVVGMRTKGPYSGTGVAPSRRTIQRNFPRWVQHLLCHFPMTEYEITLEDIGMRARQWEEVGSCWTCEGTGTIQKDNFNHFYYWAQRAGVTCARCSGKGRILHPYEARIDLSKSVLPHPRGLMFTSADGVRHAVTKQGKKRSTRCRVYREIDTMFLTGFGRVTCLLCLSWTP